MTRHIKGYAGMNRQEVNMLRYISRKHLDVRLAQRNNQAKPSK